MEKIHLEISNRYKALKNPEAATADLFRTIDNSGKFPISGGELSIAFVDDATIAQVHADFMEDPTPTDVITFPANEAMESAGEIIVSVDHARARAVELNLPFSQSSVCISFMVGYIWRAMMTETKTIAPPCEPQKRRPWQF